MILYYVIKKGRVLSKLDITRITSKDFIFLLDRGYQLEEVRL